MTLKKILENPLDYKEIKSVNSKEKSALNRIDAKAEAPMLWPLYAKSRLMGKDPDAGKEKAFLA